MISKNTSPEKKLLKQLIALPLLIAISFVFAGKEVTAQVMPPKTDKVVPSTTSGASQSLMNEYKAIVDEHKIGHINGLPEYSAFSDKEQGRLLNIFQQMTKQQQNEMNIIFRPKGLYLKKNNPTEAQLKAWLDSKTYGVWVGAERINNNELANYKPADFSWFNVSRLTKTAKNYGKHVYQVSLMTNSEFAQKIKEWNAVPDLVLSIRNGKLNFEGNRFMFVKQP